MGATGELFHDLYRPIQTVPFKKRLIVLRQLFASKSSGDCNSGIEQHIRKFMLYTKTKEQTSQHYILK